MLESSDYSLVGEQPVIRSIVLGVIALVTMNATQAAPVVWAINDGAFEDGGTFSGSFTYDADTDIYSDISINVSAWFIAPPAYVFTADSPLNSDASELFLYGGVDYVFERYLGLYFETDLTNQGGTVAIYLPVSREEFVDYGDGQPSAGERYIVSGSVTAVPIPAAAWLFGSALAGLGWLRPMGSC